MPILKISDVLSEPDDVLQSAYLNGLKLEKSLVVQQYDGSFSWLFNIPKIYNHYNQDIEKEALKNLALQHFKDYASAKTDQINLNKLENKIIRFQEKLNILETELTTKKNILEQVKLELNNSEPELSTESSFTSQTIKTILNFFNILDNTPPKLECEKAITVLETQHQKAATQLETAKANLEQLQIEITEKFDLESISKLNEYIAFNDALAEMYNSDTVIAPAPPPPPPPAPVPEYEYVKPYFD